MTPSHLYRSDVPVRRPSLPLLSKAKEFPRCVYIFFQISDNTTPPPLPQMSYKHTASQAAVATACFSQERMLFTASYAVLHGRRVRCEIIPWCNVSP